VDFTYTKTSANMVKRAGEVRKNEGKKLCMVGVENLHRKEESAGAVVCAVVAKSPHTAGSETTKIYPGAQHTQ